MIDLFSLAHIQSGEQLEHVYRSHPLRLFVRLMVAAVCLAVPFFFLYDYRGWIWIAAILCWAIGIALLWLAFDVWSSSVVLVTSERVIGAERTAWGRVRIHDWRVAPPERIPVWKPSRIIPWLGTLVWQHEDAQLLQLDWTKLLPSARSLKKHTSLNERRRRLMKLLKRADPIVIERIERDIDGPETT